MSSAISVLRKRWLALAAMVALLAVALTAGTLFAANERQQPETQPLAQQSVIGTTAPSLAPNLPATPPVPERVLAQPADTEEEIDLPPIVKVPPTYPNLDSNLNRLAEEASSAQQTRSEGGGSGATVEPVLVTFYVATDHLDNVRQYLEDNDIFVRNVGEDYIEAHVPPGLLGAASEQPGVLRVDTVIPPRPAQSQTRVISQGVGLHGAGAWHSAGYQGNDVKVGVIDIGFEGFIQLQGSELPSNATARCYFKTARVPSSQIGDCEVDGDHGTAVAETLIDVAPSVDLYIANPRTNGDLRNAVDWMAGEGVKVINYSVGKVFDGPGDGTSPFSNSPLKTIDAGVAQGVMWSVAGGNNAQQVWYGTFKDLDSDGAHHFTPRAEVNRFMVNEGDELLAAMRWDDSWGNADCDLDLLLVAYTDRWVKLFADDRVQDGRAGSYPLAAIIIKPATAAAAAGTYGLVIEKNDCATLPAWIQLIAWESNLVHHSANHHMGNPEESRNRGMMAVGATHYYNTNAIASYSSRGPTMDGRIKPEITGVACGRSSVYPQGLSDGRPCWFPGTSQAAPHVAGLAALVRQRFPNYDPAATVRYLQENASERGQSGADNTWGHGFATLPNPSLPVEIPSAPPITNLAVQAGPDAGEATLSWDVVADATYYRIGYVNMEVDYHFAKASCTGEWIEAFVYVDVNARNIPVSDGRAKYTIRRLAPGARHAFTVLTSNNFVDSGGGGSVSSEFSWPSNPRWTFLTGRNTLPSGITLPTGECTEPATSPVPSLTPTANIAVQAGNSSGEAVISWDAVPGASHYRIGYVNMEVDYHFAKASCTGEWIEAFVYVDVNARNIPVSNGRAEYTIRRLAPGARHAFTVLTSNNFVDSGAGGSVSSEFSWPSNPRWTFLPGRDALPSGVAIPQLDCGS